MTPDSGDEGAAKSAVVTFEKETAAKTALLLDNTQLGPAQVHVTASTSSVPGAKETGSSEEHHDSETIAQEDKPRSRIIAEYLAHGYVVSDKAIERAIGLDQQHGVSNRFMSTLSNFDSKFKVSERTVQVDQRLGVSNRAQQGWYGLNSYFEKAVNTPTGQKLRSFYESGSKQVMDVHNEARHLASLKTGKPEGSIMNPTSSEKTEAGVPSAEAAEMEKVTIDGQERTKCNCGGEGGKCPCPPGESILSGRVRGCN